MANLRLEEPVEQSATHEGEILSCSYTPDSSCVLSAGWDGYLRLWNAAKGITISDLQVSSKPLSACHVARDNTTWWVGTMEGMLIQWDVEKEIHNTMFLAHTRPISAMGISSENSLLFTTSWDRNIGLWNLDNRMEGHNLGTHGDIVSGGKFTPDGKKFISWSYDGLAGIWDIPLRRLTHELAGHTDRITAGDISPDGRWFLSGSRDSQIKLWDVSNGQEINSLQFQAEIVDCFFLLDAESVVVLDVNGRLTLHKLPLLGLEEDLEIEESVLCGALAPSGAQIAVGCKDGQVRFVSVDGYDTVPLAVTATQSIRMKANLFQRMFGQSTPQPVYCLICPACRTSFEIPDGKNGTRNKSALCPQCHRSIRICAVTKSQEQVVN